MRIVAASTATAAFLISYALPVTAFFLQNSFAVTKGRTANNNACDNNSCCRRASVICQLTADEILAQARAKTGINNAQQNEIAPKLFEDDLLLDMQQVLLKLEKRVKEGPGSLSLLEVDTLSRELNRISVEMRVNQDEKPPRPQRSNEEPEPSRASMAAATGFEATVTPSPSSQAAQPPPSPLSASSIPAALSGLSVSGHNPEEGAAFDGHGGMGQPRGTVNTYVIPGMDEMSPEEYRAALQKSVSDRQAVRRRTTTVGNASSRNYLDNLSRKPEENDE